MVSDWTTAIVSFLAANAGTIAAGAGIGTGLAAAARHIQGFIEGKPWYEDPIGNLKADAINFGTSFATAGIGKALGPMIGTGLGTVAGQSGAAVGQGGQGITRTLLQGLGQVAKAGVAGAASGAVSSAAQGNDPGQGALIGAATGGAGKIAGGINISGETVPPGGQSEASLVGSGPSSMNPEIIRTDAGLRSEAFASPQVDVPDYAANIAKPLYQKAADTLIAGVRYSTPLLSRESRTLAQGAVASALTPQAPTPPMSPYKSGYLGNQYSGIPVPFMPRRPSFGGF